MEAASIKIYFGQFSTCFPLSGFILLNPFDLFEIKYNPFKSKWSKLSPLQVPSSEEGNKAKVIKTKGNFNYASFASCLVY